MGFIIGDTTVINIKLTDKGRELLSRGRLNFSEFAIGDSEIDYEFNSEINFDATNATILRPNEKEPQIVSFITKEVGGLTKASLGTVVSNTSLITNTATERGFFTKSGGIYYIKDDAKFSKQPDIAVEYSNATGGNNLTLVQSQTYNNNVIEPEVGDYIVIRWGNPDYGNTTGFTVNAPIAYIWYKIEGISSGNLANNNLVVTLDKPTPNFNGSGSGEYAGGVLYPNSNNRGVSGDSIQTYYGSPFITDFASEALLAFLTNCDPPTIDVPIWNMAIVFTKEIEGVDDTSDRNMSQYYSKSFGGFVNYVQRVSPTVERIGIIHYTNNSPANQYGEGFVKDTPVLELPTIMWHKNINKEIGLTLSASTSGKTLQDLNINYQDLVDSSGNVVGKVFYELKLFVIEDQELLYAMSYKANRNWTLPSISAGFNTYKC